MDAVEIQQKMNDYHYWDARVLELSCNYFADEIKLCYEDTEGNIVYDFKGCYSAQFNHALEYEKEVPTSKLLKSQLPYFIQDVEVKAVNKSGLKLYECKINMPPLNLEILCTDIVVKRINDPFIFDN